MEQKGPVRTPFFGGKNEGTEKGGKELLFSSSSCKLLCESKTPIGRIIF